MDGLEATRRLRQDPRCRQLPIIAMTAHVLDDDRVRCTRAGMDDYVAKPINPRTLCETLAHCLNRAAGISAVPPGASARVAPPGLDVENTLERLSGKMPLYLRLLGDFERDWMGAPGRLVGLWDAGRCDEARQMIHTLKGVAANLGAAGVARAASDLLRLMKAADGDIGGLLPSLGRELRVAFDSAAMLSRDSAPPPAPLPLRFIDSLSESMGQLDDLLRRNNVAAIDAATALVTRLDRERYGDNLMKLEAKVSALDFRGARAILSALRAEIGQSAPDGDGE